ncbi:MAG: DegT/DnrJ/EryC1/StrS family aminotransferase [Phycisphaerae bacterium]
MVTKQASLRKPKPFGKPIYITHPVLPDLSSLTKILEQIWKSGWLTNNGEQHQLFEQNLKTKLRAPYVSVFNNGTTALMTALQALRLSGEVITTPFTFPATVHVLAWNGIKPVFCDIDPVTMNIDTEKIESAITPTTTAILPVHTFGYPCEVKGIQKIADLYGLRVVYDAAHVFGVEIDSTPIGNFGDISMLSFHATKIFHTAEGGALVFKDANLKRRIEFLKNFGIKNEEEVVMPGINGKMNEIQAAIGNLVLNEVDNEIEKRRYLTAAYNENLKDVEGITFNSLPENVKGNYGYFVIRIDKRKFGRSRDDVYGMFKDYNVFTRKYFYPLCSDFQCYKHLPSSSPTNLPVAQKVSREVLCLPLYGRLSVSDVEQICTILKSFRI